MRPDRFQDYIQDLARTQPSTQAQTFSEAGQTTYPYGLTITTPRSQTRWQIIGQLANGERHSTPAAPVHANPPPDSTAPQTTDTPEAWLAALLTNAHCTEIATIDRWSTRKDAAINPGITVSFHNGARIFARQL
ncbi:hypothetical protein [Streptomyces sp. NPDC088178]|uniref:hypothetical protein n=1 Tax=Streptomyces sp. NPDC088178 TaxID=3365836 RepID=UPI0037F1160A